jgi:predicted  nucleic acid-binding Zn-ribbon protein
MSTARLFRQGVLVEPRPETCLRCVRQRARRRRTASVLRRLHRETTWLRRQVANLEGRIASASSPPDAQMAALAETITNLRERLAHQELRFSAANERHAREFRACTALNQYQEGRINVLQKRLNKAHVEIARLKGLKP